MEKKVDKCVAGSVIAKKKNKEKKRGDEVNRKYAIVSGIDDFLFRAGMVGVLIVTFLLLEFIRLKKWGICLHSIFYIRFKGIYSL